MRAADGGWHDARVESTWVRRAAALVVIVVCVTGMALVVAIYGIDSAAAVASLVASFVAVGAALFRWSGSPKPAPATLETTSESASGGAELLPEPRPSAPVRGPWQRGRGAFAAGLAAVVAVVLVAVWRMDPPIGSNSPRGQTTESSAAGQGTQSVTIDKIAWYGGYRVAFGAATYSPAEDPPLTIALKVENLGRTDRGLFEFELPISVGFGGRTSAGVFPGPTVTIGAGSAIDVTVEFELEEPVANLAAGTLTIGANADLPAKVPIGSGGELVALEPVPVLTDTAVTVTNLRFTHVSCDLRGDDMVEHEQVPKGNIAIGCTFDVAYHGQEIDIGIFAENFRLVMPDGDLRAPLRGPIESVGRDQEERGLRVVFVVPWPAPGRYALRLLDRDRYGGEVISTADLPLTMSTS